MDEHQYTLRRATQEVKRIVAEVIDRELKDPRIGLASVVGVELSPDFRHASIYISVLGDEEERRITFEGLESAKGYIRSELGERTRLKYVPEIRFVEDRSIERGARIDEIIRRINDHEEE